MANNPLYPLQLNTSEYFNYKTFCLFVTLKLITNYTKISILLMAKNILIIEDDAEILRVLETVLTFHDFEVTGLDRTDDIIAAVKNYNPDLVLTDYMLPGLNGGRICQLIKGNEDTRHIPVILISAYHEQAIALVNFGYDAFVPKPFDVNKLVKTINRFLN